MSKKNLILVTAAVVIIAGGWMVYRQQKPQTQFAAYQNSNKDVTATAASETAALIGSVYAVIVTYTDSWFSPPAATMPKGSVVIFRNHSSKNLRVASNLHPTHDGYPEKNGCVGSTFDSCDNIPPNVSWSFAFGNSGSWGYHNHLNPSQGGTIIVR